MIKVKIQYNQELAFNVCKRQFMNSKFRKYCIFIGIVCITSSIYKMIFYQDGSEIQQMVIGIMVLIGSNTPIIPNMYANGF